MKSYFKKIVLVLFVLLSIFIFLFLRFFFVFKPLQLDGKISLNGISSSIELITDNNKIHIRAQNKEDLYFALGYYHAAKNLYYMDYLKRASLGQLSEVLGKKYIKSDLFARQIDFNGIGNKCMKITNSETQDILDSYTNGINEYIKNNLKNLPLEFRFNEYQPLLWNSSDCLAISRLFAWLYSDAWNKRILFYNLLNVYNPRKVTQGFPANINDIPYLYRPTNEINNIAINNFWQGENDLRNYLDFQDNSHFSQSLIIAGSKSDKSLPILSGNISNSFVYSDFYSVIDLTCPEFSVSGITCPGIPAIISGKNQSIAWTMNKFSENDIDLYLEKVDQIQEKVLWDSTWIKLQKRTELIKVKNNADTSLIVYSTKHGPIINNFYNAESDTSEMISFWWDGFISSRDIEGLIGINKSSNWESFLEQTKKIKFPQLKIGYADIDGNIGMSSAVPLIIHPKRKTMLLEGHNPNNDIFEDYTLESYSIFNPKTGFISSQNFQIDINMIYPYYHKFFQKILYSSTISISDIKKFQSNNMSPYAKIITSFLATVKENDMKNSLEKSIYNKLKKWNFSEKTYSLESYFTNHLVKKIAENVYKDDLDLANTKLFHEFLNMKMLPYKNLQMLCTNDPSLWFDNVQTLDHERQKDIMLSAYQNTIKYLINKNTNDLSKWNCKENIHNPINQQKRIRFIISYLLKKMGKLPHTSIIQKNVMKSAQHFNRHDNSLKFIIPFSQKNTMLISQPSNNNQYINLLTNKSKLVNENTEILTIIPKNK